MKNDQNVFSPGFCIEFELNVHFLIKLTRYREYVVVDRCCERGKLSLQHETPSMDANQIALGWTAAGRLTL